MKIFLFVVVWIVTDLTIFQVKTIFNAKIPIFLGLWLIFVDTFPTIMFFRACVSFMTILSDPALELSMEIAIIIMLCIYLILKILNVWTTKRLTK